MAQEILARPMVESRAKVIAHPAERRVAPRPAAYAVATHANDARRTVVQPIRVDPARHAAEKAEGSAAPPVVKPVSLNIAAGVLRGFDALIALAAGPAALALSLASLPLPASQYLLISLLGALVLVNLLHLFGTYRLEMIRRTNPVIGRIALAWVTTAAIATGALLISDAAFQIHLHWLMLWTAIGLGPLLASRAVFAACIGHWRKHGRLQRRVAVLGSGPIGQRLLRRINAQADPDLVVTGVYDDRLARLPVSCMGHKIRGSADDLIEHVRQNQIDTVVVALPLSAERRMGEVIAKLRQVAVDVCLCPDQFGFQVTRASTRKMGGVTLLCVEERPLRDWRGIAKEIEDRVVAGLILLMIAPLLAAIAVLIKIDSPGPVFFRQKRYGLNNQLIEVLKFRTMYHHATDANAEQLTRRNDPRVTRLGAFLRRTSLDELPQFINVLRGEMSVVGPRPHALAAKAGGLLYQDAVRHYYARHRMKPGITGWAQVNGWRGETETVEQIAKRVEHDLHYIENWSVWLDLTIILRTIFGGFTGRQAY